MPNNKPNKRYRYVTVYEDLLNKITADVFPINSLLPSEREIGTMYSVERTTVRKALDLLVADGIVKKQPGIGAKVVSKEKTTFQAPNTANNDTVLFFLAKTKSNVDRLTQPFYSSLFYYIEIELKKQGYKTIYSTLSSDDNIKEILKNYTYAGIIFASYGISDKHIDFATKANLPFVVVNSDHTNSVSIIPDNFSGGYKATNHLIDLGHTRIGALMGLTQDKSCQDRSLGFKVALEENGINYNKNYIRSTSWEAASGFVQMKDILLTNSVLPTAIFAFNDATALGAIRAIHEMGLKVPDDISVIGLDNISQSEYIFPQLSTIDTNVKIISSTTALALQAKIKKIILHNMRIVIPVTLIVRGSTKPFKNT